MAGLDAGITNSKIIEVRNLSFAYPEKEETNLIGKEYMNILNDISFSVKRNTIVGIAGRSGCGKTTLGKIITNYFKYNQTNCRKSGKVFYNSENGKNYDLDLPVFMDDYKISPIQMIFQEPRTSLNMKMALRKQLFESISLQDNSLSKVEKENILYQLSKELYINDILDKKPKNISGGQRRRFGIAKILSVKPDVILADEPVASLDVSIKYEILEVLFGLKKKGITIIMISHDISLLENYADVIFIMNEGEIVEEWNPSLNELPVSEDGLELVNDSKFVNQIIDKLG